MSSRSTSASMLSMLSQPIQSVPGDSFNDYILLLLAAVATTDDMFTHREYQPVQEAAQAIFGERALHAELQAKLHYALLNPPSDPAGIARDMANQADAQKVSSTFVDTVLKAPSCIGGQEERIDGKARSLVNDIEWAFRKSRPGRSTGWGIGLELNVGESLGRLYRKATSALLPRKEITGWFTPETSQFNVDMERFVNSLDRIAWTLDDMDLREELYIFRKMLRCQPFKVVVVGERKRGKSSLIDAIIGQKPSPMRESTPETATVVESEYAHIPDYSVQFLDSSQFAWLKDYLENEQDNLLLARKIEHIRKGVPDGMFTSGKLLSGIACWDGLSDYISPEGHFSGFVARVSVGLPLDTLRAGVVLVDTPGLNNTDQFHDYLSYGENLEADCVIFVMDAHDPGSNSELSLLRKLARGGCTVSIIGMLTNVDRLNSAASLEVAREQACTVLREACRNSGHVELTGTVALNTRQAVGEHCRGGSVFSETLSKVSRSVSGCGELEQLLAFLREIMDRDAGKEAYRHKITETYSRIAGSARERLRQHAQKYRESLPSPGLLGVLDTHAKQLSASALSSLEQARQVVNAATKDLDVQDESTERALKKFHEILVLRFMDAVDRKVADLGYQFAKDSVWKEFDVIEARVIARRTVDEFLDEQRGIFHTWEDKLRLFSARMDEFSQEYLACLSSNTDGLQGDPGEMSGSSSTATHFLVQTHRHMKDLTVFTTGLTVGRPTALGPISMLVIAGNIIALAVANPPAAAVFVAMAGAAGLLYHLGRENKRRAAFLSERRHETEEYVERVCDAPRQELVVVREDLDKAYEFEVKRGFAPALESLFHQSVHLRLFLDVMQKTHSDVSRYDMHVQKQLEQLGGVLERRYQGAAPAKADFLLNGMK